MKKTLSEREKVCSDCNTIFITRSNRKYRCDDCQKTSTPPYKETKIEYLSKRRNSVNQRLFDSISHRRNKYKNIFDLSVEDIVIPNVCPILGTEFIPDTVYSPSVDRIDNDKGYMKGNIQIVSRKANAMKNSASKEELIKFADWIYKTYKENKKMNKKQVEDYLENELEENTFEEVLEMYDLTPAEVFTMLFNYGHIDPEILEARFNAY